MQKSIEQKKKDVGAKLKRAAKKVTEQDKAECRAATGVGITTINRYLKGDVALLPVGESLLNFFTNTKMVA